MILRSIQLRTSKQYYITEAYSLYYYTAAYYDILPIFIAESGQNQLLLLTNFRI